MDTLSYKTKSATPTTIKRSWHIVDAEGETLGRMASAIAQVLKGKNKPYYTPHMDCGDYVIVVNAAKFHLTGRKMFDKIYLSHTGYPGGQREITPEKLLAKKPIAPVEKAVKGMLPKNKLGRAMYRKLFVYEGSEHPHAAQQPVELKINK